MIRVSNNLDSDQAGHFVGLIWVQTVCKSYQQMTKVEQNVQPDLGPNCLQKLSADDKIGQNIGPDLGPKCLQTLSADDKSRTKHRA